MKKQQQQHILWVTILKSSNNECSKLRPTSAIKATMRSDCCISAKKLAFNFFYIAAIACCTKTH